MSPLSYSSSEWFVQPLEGGVGEPGSVDDVGESPCTHVTELLSTKLDHVRKLLEELHALEIDLVHLIQRGERLDPSRCTPGEICQILTACQPADDID